MQSGQASQGQQHGSRDLKEVRKLHRELREVGSSLRQQVHRPYLVGLLESSVTVGRLVLLQAIAQVVGHKVREEMGSDGIGPCGCKDL